MFIIQSSLTETHIRTYQYTVYGKKGSGLQKITTVYTYDTITYVHTYVTTYIHSAQQLHQQYEILTNFGTDGLNEFTDILTVINL